MTCPWCAKAELHDCEIALFGDRGRRIGFVMILLAVLNVGAVLVVGSAPTTPATDAILAGSVAAAVLCFICGAFLRTNRPMLACLACGSAVDRVKLPSPR